MRRPQTLDEAIEMWGQNRPEVMGKVVPLYENDYSEIPDRIRVSFSDGHTAVYDLHTDQPAPVILENIRIIRRMKNGYQYKQRRARR